MAAVKTKIEPVDVSKKFTLIQEYWSPKIVGSLNDSYLKLAKMKGKFIWHRHEKEDELFLVVRGELKIQLRSRDLNLGEGEFVIIPKGVEHRPVAEQEVHLMLMEPKSTVNTGNIRNKKTVKDEWI